MSQPERFFLLLFSGDFNLYDALVTGLVQLHFHAYSSDFSLRSAILYLLWLAFFNGSGLMIDFKDHFSAMHCLIVYHMVNEKNNLPNLQEA